MKRNQKIIVVMPAYNAEKTIEQTYRDIPKGVADEVIVVDDASHDRTIAKAKSLGLRTVTHPKNLGYGGNQKTCYRTALGRGADIVVMIHPDYQYDATLTGKMVDPIKRGEYDIMLGSRIRTRAEALSGGMPVWKYAANRFLTIIENIVLSLNLSEYHTGFRAYSAAALKRLPLEKNSNDFIFDQEILVEAVSQGMRIGEIPVPVRYFDEASSINFTRSVVYGLATLGLLMRYLLDRSRIIKDPRFAQGRVHVA
ncbi:glycosyltransferase family 2 protein [Candidatus Berkelbacteria bacterium]|nr:glycosyltransferase family 2 protein [Candidatus Berkelbacteria bacterium]